MKTKAAILYQLNAPLVLEDVEIPKLKKGQLLVKIYCSGVCRAQLNEMIGLKGPDKYLPHLLGHEASAEVVDIGPGVKKVKRGDYVVLSWIKGNGLDGIRSAYRIGGKVINAGGVTTFSDYSVVSENRVTPLSRKIPSEVAAILGCAVATGAGIINNSLSVAKGSSIAIFGSGGVGASAIMAAKAKGCRVIIAVDIGAYKLAFARRLGATHGIDASKKDVLKEIHRIVPLGLDFGIDASGVKSAMEKAFESLHDRGKLIIAGNLGKNEKIEIHPFDLIKGKRILGTWGGETVPQRDFPRYALQYRKGVLPLDQLITHRFRLEQINEAFDLLKTGLTGRIIIVNRL